MSKARLSGKSLFLFPFAWPLTWSVSNGEVPFGVLWAVHHELGYCAPLSPGAAGCVMALLPSGKAR